MGKPKLIYIAPAAVSFVRNDIKGLRAEYDIIQHTYSWGSGIGNLIVFIKQFFLLLFQIPKSNAVLISSGGLWAFWPVVLSKVLGKKVVIILNGADCAAIPSMNYGKLRKGFLRNVIGFALKHASALAPVSESLVEVSNSFSDAVPSKQGYLHHFPKITTDYSVIPNGFDAAFWQVDARTERDPNAVITVLTAARFKLKGGLLVLEAARKMPEQTFHFVGLESTELDLNLPDNAIFHGQLSPEKLRTLYYTSSIYIQASYFEGFGCALSEAMLCGCIPIASNINAMPLVIGDNGIVIMHPTVNDLTSAIGKISNTVTPEQRLNAAQHIAKEYPLERRLRMISELLN